MAYTIRSLDNNRVELIRGTNGGKCFTKFTYIVDVYLNGCAPAMQVASSATKLLEKCAEDGIGVGVKTSRMVVTYNPNNAGVLVPEEEGVGC